MTVLILASDRDISADRMVRALADRGVPVFRTDLSRFPQQLVLDAELRDGRWTGRLTTPYREMRLEELRSVWYRNPSSFHFPVAMSGPERQHAQHEAKLGLGGVLGALPVRWVNHPSRHADAGYKPHQLVAAAQAGLSVAPTLITNNAAAMRRFAARSGPDGVVTEMLGASAICEQGGRRVALTQRLIDSDFDDLRGVELTAHLVQRWASKREEARVIVIGSHVFAVAIRAHDVLEIGTGTGYNAALLAHRLGAGHVFSVEVDHELVDLARDRLAHIGYRPTLVVTDGASGLPEHAPYDRIMATCSVSAIPRAWLDQTRIGGLILADLKLSVHAGNLVLLTRLTDRAEGRFERTWAGFMALRPTVPATATPTVAGRRVTRDRAQARMRTTDVGQLHPWDNLVVWFLAQLTVPGEIGYGHTVNGAGDVFLTSADGSWCEVSNHIGSATRQVWEAGPTPLWRALEDADQLWHDLGRPGWDRFGLTVTTERQWIWLDSPDSDHTWPLAALDR